MCLELNHCQEVIISQLTASGQTEADAVLHKVGNRPKKANASSNLRRTSRRALWQTKHRAQPYRFLDGQARLQWPSLLKRIVVLVA